jgi:hypothetical protein
MPNQGLESAGRLQDETNISVAEATCNVNRYSDRSIAY